ncbi:hypothetical protein [Xylella fastidiosa]|nr:hypothetical protein [Xylella fastidiosa]MRU28307.1 hypothetical protein [Xylella fastidiosa subsp. multiplex]MRU30697.1 hypothetical protein [Xylella fastidiosa subsp. multiplex]UIT53425.1 hypothetical protein LZ753_11370 [Xylella fastidiosa subsp. fastidiosa]WLE28572.1 hypothetical protein DVS74_011650 [Xylella fastidiosa subsp. multiplex]
MTFKASAMLLAVGLVLTGCDGNKDSVQDSKGQTNGLPASLLNSPKLPDLPPPLADAASAPTLPKPDRNVPVASYVDLNREPAGMALTYIVFAKEQDAVSDEDKLNSLSPSYYNETDVFKKKDLAATELPRINAAMDGYRKHDYYTLPVSKAAEKPLVLTNLAVGQYDFNTKSFPLTNYGEYCWGMSLLNQQRVRLKILPSDLPCGLPVSDEVQAKLIEAARAQNALVLQGTLYLYVPRAENGTALAVVLRAHLELVNAKTKALLGRFDL